MEGPDKKIERIFASLIFNIRYRYRNASANERRKRERGRGGRVGRLANLLDLDV